MRHLWLMNLDVVDQMCAAMSKMDLSSKESLPQGIKWNAASRGESPAKKSVAVLPLVGMIEQRQSIMGYIFGGTSTEIFGAMFNHAVNDPQVKGIVVDCHSPGGTYWGTPELGETIYQARGSKPIVALANPMVASACLWIASACDRVYVTPSGEVGSHGVLYKHEDWSGLNERQGIKPEYVYAGEHKIDGNSDAPLSESAREEIQKQVNECMDEFTAVLARNRGVTKDEVLARFGQGKMFSARNAVAAGLADRIATFDEVVSRMLSGHIRTDTKAAMDDWTSPIRMQEPDRQAATEPQLTGLGVRAAVNRRRARM